LPPVVHAIRREAAATLLERGAVWAESPRDLTTQCDVICTCVPGPPEMQAVMLGPNGVLEGLRPGSAVIDHTTNAPGVVREVGVATQARRAHLLDAPPRGGRRAPVERRPGASDRR